MKYVKDSCIGLFIISFQAVISFIFQTDKNNAVDFFIRRIPSIIIIGLLFGSYLFFLRVVKRWLKGKIYIKTWVGYTIVNGCLFWGCGVATFMSLYTKYIAGDRTDICFVLFIYLISIVGGFIGGCVLYFLDKQIKRLAKSKKGKGML